MIDLATTPFFHGTSSVFEADLRHQIRAGHGDNYGGMSQLGPGFYITPHQAAADYFALGACGRVGGMPIVLAIGIPARSWVGMVVPESVWWDVPAALITQYDYLEAPITGLPMWYNVKFNPHVCHLLWVL